MGKTIVIVSLAGFLGAGALLLFGHPSFAIKITNHLFFFGLAFFNATEK